MQKHRPDAFTPAPLKPAAFRYVRAESIEHALEAKAHAGDESNFLAGGQSLIPAMNFRLATPSVLIDLNRVDALSYVRNDVDGALRIGAMTRHRTLGEHPAIARAQPLLHETVPSVAHPQVRNRGTLGGNLSHADPASEYPAVMLALDATMTLRSQRGAREVAARDFFVNVYTTALADDELLAEVRLPALPPGAGSAFLEVSRRQGDYAMMGVASVLALDAAGRVTHARIACCNAGATAVLATQAAALLAGQRPADDPAGFGQAVEAAAQAVRDAVEPGGGVHATVAYQRHLAGVLARRTLQRSAERALAGIAQPGPARPRS